jgi:hypothetical protein
LSKSFSINIDANVSSIYKYSLGPTILIASQY